jgi:hypothetical protein
MLPSKLWKFLGEQMDIQQIQKSITVRFIFTAKESQRIVHDSDFFATSLEDYLAEGTDIVNYDEVCNGRTDTEGTREEWYREHYIDVEIGMENKEADLKEIAEKLKKVVAREWYLCPEENSWSPAPLMKSTGTSIRSRDKKYSELMDDYETLRDNGSEEVDEKQKELNDFIELMKSYNEPRPKRDYMSENYKSEDGCYEREDYE